MMTTYEPGTVAVATVCGVPNVRVFRTRSAFYPWETADEVDMDTSHSEGDVTDVRPLVVLDLDGTAFADRLTDTLRSIHMRGSSIPEFLILADQIEAQTKPPRIPEPGLWGVVEAGVKQHDVRLQWVRLGDNYRPNDDGEYDRLWSDLVDPVLIRDGIEDGAS